MVRDARPGGGYLYDVLEDYYRDSRVRPNQIFAASLNYSPIAPEIGRRVVDMVAAKLLVPCALRTLAPGEDGYRGSYLGDVAERESAYHQGTAWMWLLAPYARAHIRVYGYNREHLRKLLEPILELLKRRAVGHLPEILDGDAPHTPRGTFAHASSTAAVLEILAMLKSPPKFGEM